MIIKKGFIAEGTTCTGCEKIIKKQALKVKGVKEVSFDYSIEEGYVTFDDTKTDIDEILYKIEEKGYTCFILSDKKAKNNKLFGWIFTLVGIIVVGYFLFQFVEGIQLPRITQGMGYGLLLLVGFLTGFHCIGMCGGFVVGYTTKCAQDNKKPHKAHLMYAVGKTLSYTIIGAMFGLLGSIIAFTPMMRGIVGGLAGLFLILYGLKMLNLFPALRKLNIKTPKFIWKFVKKEKKQHNNPLIIGLLNGLMIACGPLQAIYIMAAGTGSMIEGAKLLFVFGIGTLPAMITFGYFVSFISQKAANKIVKLSGVVVIVLGLIMINNGLVLTGTGYDFQSLTTKTLDVKQNTLSGVQVKNGYQEIRMEVNRYGWEPDTFVLEKDVPVKWIIDGKEINGCNNAIQVPKYDLNFDIQPGEQVIEFTPTESGDVRWSCWMGMIPGMFIVKDDVGGQADIQKELQQAPQLVGGSCGGGGTGGCGCGG